MQYRTTDKRASKKRPLNKQTRKRLQFLRTATQIFVCLLTLSTPLAAQAAPVQSDKTENGIETGAKQAVSKDDAEIASILTKALAGKKYPGVIGAIAKEGQPLRIAATGVRKAGTEVLITSNDMVHIGSCTKAMTATIAAKFVQRDWIKWETTLEEAWPEVGKSVHADWKKITLEQCLMHRSGLPAHIDFEDFEETGSIRDDRKKLAIASMQEKPEFKPGSKFAYSNLGYMVAGGMLESQSGKSWEELMREEIFGPLKMTSGDFGIVGTEGETDQPWGHIRDGLGNPFPVQTDNPAPLGPAGTVKVTVADWAKFVLQHTDCGDEKFLSAALHDELVRPGPTDGYAKGWFAVDRSWADGTALNHAGSNTTWYALVWASRKNKVAYFVVMNCHSDSTEKKADEIIGKLIELDRNK